MEGARASGAEKWGTPRPLLCGLGDDTKSGRASASSWIRCKLLHPLHGVTVKSTAGMCGGIFSCHNWGAGVAIGFQRVAARDAAEHPAKHRTAPTAKNDLAPNASSAEKP